MSRTSKRKAVKKSAETAGFSCYVGPSVLGLIQKNSIYPGSVEDARKACAEAIRRYPLVSQLIVDGTQLGDALVKVRTPGTYLYEMARKVFMK